ncbi:MAG: hypothetical protein IJK64_02045 [Clostridia bacterium]|nr:hypothetical protein [Clostridia bacterium]
MKVSELAALPEFTAVTLPDADREITGVYIGDLLSWVMGRAQADDAWITIMSNVNVVAVASLADVACVLLAEDVALEDAVKETAAARGINVLSSPLSAYDIACRLHSLL